MKVLNRYEVIRMRLSISETARFCGVSVRTLHYYDQIGLLAPSEITESGYRYYKDEALEKLQQILFYRELEFPLKEIQNILSHPDYDKRLALQRQKELLQMKKDRLEGLIRLADQQLKGEKAMSFQEFDQSAITEAMEKYADEVKERWGDSEAYRESSSKTEKYTEQDWKLISEEENQIFQAFAKLRQEDPGCEEARKLVRMWQEHISKYFYHCTDEILSGLGEMYSMDERFAKNIDKAGEGTAHFMSQAILKACGR